MKPRTGYSKKQAGQAMVEFLIAATTVLIPLFLLVPLLGKYMDMKASAIQAARYAAWERTVWFGSSDWSAAGKTDTQIQHEVQQRFFADTATVKLQSSDMNSAGSSLKPLWRDRAGTAMLANNDTNATQSSPRSTTPGTLNAVLDPVLTVIGVVDKVLGAEFKLDMKSLYTSTVTMQTAPTTPIRQVLGSTSSLETFASVTPVFAEKNVLVANGWSANGVAFVKQQTEGLVVLSVLQRDPVKTVLDIVQTVAGLIYPELGKDWLKLGGEIQPDIVPDDRLSK